MVAVHSLVLEVIKKYSVDEKRIYVTGESGGGVGTWYMVMRWPELFAAAIPVCGVGDPRMAEVIKKVPIRTFHGALDNVVPVKATRSMVEAIKKAGGDITYIEYPEVTHSSWRPAWKDPETIKWLFEQTK